MRTNGFSVAFLVVASFMLASCGRSEGTPFTAPPTPANNVPTIAAVTPATATLDATNNATTITAMVTDESVSTLAYAWTITAGGSFGTLTDATMATATFTLTPGVMTAGVVTIQLIVTDADGMASAPMDTDIGVLFCNSYDDGGTARAGTIMESNCLYDADFTANVLDDEDLTLPNLPNRGAHIFTGSLVVGRADMADRTLTIEPGARVAFSQVADFLVVHRGSQIMAMGTADNPITITSDEDVAGEVASTVVGQWGGVAIAGRGLDQDCNYEGLVGDRARTFATDNPWQLAADTPTVTGACNRALITGVNAGGTDDGDDSGVLTYVVIKHTGSTNNAPALNLGAVGNATTINNIQIFAASGVGVEMQGGNFDAENILIYDALGHGLNMDGGYLGDIDRVLVSQGTHATGSVCVLLRNRVQFQDSVDINKENTQTLARVSRMTCATDGGTPAQGFDAQNGAQLTVVNAMVTIDDSDSNRECAFGNNFNLDLGTTGMTALSVTAAVLSCRTGSFTGQELIRAPFAVRGDPTTTADPLINFMSAAGTTDMRPIFSVLHAETVVTAAGATAALDRDMYAPEGEGLTFLGAISTGANPFAGWTFGVFVAPAPTP